MITSLESLILSDELFIAIPKGSVFTTPQNLALLKPLHQKRIVYFDVTSITIEETAFNKLYISTLSAEVKSDFGVLIKTNKEGIVIGIEHMQSHHIFPKGEPKLRELFKTAGMDIDAAQNRIFLPDAIGKSLYPTI